MKRAVRRMVRLLVVAALLAAAAVAWQLHGQRNALEDERHGLDIRIRQHLRTQAALRNEIRSLQEALTAQSNRVSMADEALRRERETNEPLRRQLQQLVSGQVRDEARFESLQKQIQRGAEAIRESQAQAERLAALKSGADNRLETLQSAWAASNSVLKARITGLEDEIARGKRVQVSLTRDKEQIRQKLNEAQTQAAAQSKARADAEAKVRELEKVQAASKPPPATP
jgi:chromosome segregation ATPase